MMIDFRAQAETVAPGFRRVVVTRFRTFSDAGRQVELRPGQTYDLIEAIADSLIATGAAIDPQRAAATAAPAEVEPDRSDVPWRASGPVRAGSRRVVFDQDVDWQHAGRPVRLHARVAYDLPAGVADGLAGQAGVTVDDGDETTHT